jgi:hypothetical protein
MNDEECGAGFGKLFNVLLLFIDVNSTGSKLMSIYGVQIYESSLNVGRLGTDLISLLKSGCYATDCFGYNHHC